MAIRGVIFDFNGTLFWDGDKNEAAWRAFALRHAGRTITDQEFLDLHGRPNREFIGFLLGYKDGEITLQIGDEKISFAKKDVAVVRPNIEFDEDDLKDDRPEGEEEV